MKRAFVIGILGAESTGKTALARELYGRVAQWSSMDAPRVAIVAEYLREFCDVHGRTPRADEQAGIASEQTRRIALAAATHDIVIADTTAVMIAVYSEIVFGDLALYAEAERSHATQCDLTLLTALDLPWQADGHQRDGPHVRAPVDALVRASLNRANAEYSVIRGSGLARVSAAQDALHRSIRMRPLASPDQTAASLPSTGWKYICACCGDPDCERALKRP